MASPSDAVGGYTTYVVDVSPNVVDAEEEMTLCVKATPLPRCDLRGHALLVTDQTGASVARIELSKFDGETNEANALIVNAPIVPGEHTWLVVSSAVVKDGVAYAEAASPISFTVKPHRTYIVAWDIPSAIVAGERFRIKVGMKCSHECHMTHRDFGIYDHEGTLVSTALLPDEQHPGTSGLRVADVELEAPVVAGLYTWTIKNPKSDEGIPHAEGSTSLGIRVVSHPECVVTIEAVDRLSQMPLDGARVVMHPYRAVANERGVAEVHAAKGAYRLFVSQTGYLTISQPVEVTADMTARVELDVELPAERN